MITRTDIPVMLLGLKRDLRIEMPGVVFPQEVSLKEEVCRWADDGLAS